MVENATHVKKAWDQASLLLTKAGITSAQLDSQLLLAHALKISRTDVVVSSDRELSKMELKSFWQFIARRTHKEPLAYITGQKEFWSLPIQVDQRVLVPRPDSETILEEVAEIHKKVWMRPDKTCKQIKFTDIGTGSGCLACALASMFPTARGLATDVEPGALSLAASNLSKLGFSSRVQLQQGYLLEPLQKEKFDLICANLPYIASPDIDNLAEDIRFFEPLSALDGGNDGLRLLRELIAGVSDNLAANGFVLLEVGIGQAPEVVRFCKQAGLIQVHTRKDLSGIDRVVIGKRPNEAGAGTCKK